MDFHRKIRLKVLILLLLLSPSVFGQQEGSGWCYQGASCGPPTWTGLCSSGSSQSPINIPPSKLSPSALSSTRLFLNKNYGVPKSFFVKNTGRTLQVSLNSDDKSKCFLRGDGLGAKEAFFLGQLHFHWGPNNLLGSEHTVGGKRYPLEMHMVHHLSSNPDRIAVLAVFFTLSSRDNPNLKPILDLVSKVRTADAVAKSKGQKLTLTSLFPRRMRMYRYKGSLTTPPCSETVVWTIFKDPLPVSKGQLKVFRTLLSRESKNLTSNYRPVQPTFTKTRKKIYSVRQLKTISAVLEEEPQPFPEWGHPWDHHHYYPEPEPLYHPNLYGHHRGDFETNYNHFYGPNF